jgi:hypothetical protein
MECNLFSEWVPASLMLTARSIVGLFYTLFDSQQSDPLMNLEEST